LSPRDRPTTCSPCIGLHDPSPLNTAPAWSPTRTSNFDACAVGVRPTQETRTRAALGRRRCNLGASNNRSGALESLRFARKSGSSCSNHWRPSMHPTDELVPILKKMHMSGVMQSLELRTRQAVDDCLVLQARPAVGRASATDRGSRSRARPPRAPPTAISIAAWARPDRCTWSRPRSRPLRR
jgi:hypothetical protein